MVDVKDLFGELAELYAQADALRLHKQDLMKTVIPLDVQAKLDDIEAEIGAQQAVVAEKTAVLEVGIKSITMEQKASLAGDLFHCVYNPGGKTVSVGDVEAFADELEHTSKRLAAKLRTLLKQKKDSCSIQAIRNPTIKK